MEIYIKPIEINKLFYPVIWSTVLLSLHMLLSSRITRHQARTETRCSKMEQNNFSIVLSQKKNKTTKTNRKPRDLSAKLQRGKNTRQSYIVTTLATNDTNGWRFILVLVSFFWIDILVLVSTTPKTTKHWKLRFQFKYLNL